MFSLYFDEYRLNVDVVDCAESPPKLYVFHGCPSRVLVLLFNMTRLDSQLYHEIARMWNEFVPYHVSLLNRGETTSWLSFTGLVDGPFLE